MSFEVSSESDSDEIEKIPLSEILYTKSPFFNNTKLLSFHPSHENTKNDQSENNIFLEPCVKDDCSSQKAKKEEYNSIQGNEYIKIQRVSKKKSVANSIQKLKEVINIFHKYYLDIIKIYFIRLKEKVEHFRVATFTPKYLVLNKGKFVSKKYHSHKKISHRMLSSLKDFISFKIQQGNWKNPIFNKTTIFQMQKIHQSEPNLLKRINRHSISQNKTASKKMQIASYLSNSRINNNFDNDINEESQVETNVRNVKMKVNLDSLNSNINSLNNSTVFRYSPLNVNNCYIPKNINSNIYCSYNVTSKNTLNRKRTFSNVRMNKGKYLDSIISFKKVYQIIKSNEPKTLNMHNLKNSFTSFLK